MIVTIHAKPLRISQRRKQQETDEFKIKYRRRSGIESTNSLLKRVTGLGRLRVRAKASVFQSLLLKVAGWNILRAASSKRLMRSLKGLLTALFRLIELLAKQRQTMAFDR
jgi:IS5 family transposase